MTLPHIHQDIIDEIVYHLRYDLTTLKACSTVSRAFFLPARRHLLSRIVLTPSTLGRFQSLLESSPEIKEFVNTIDIHIHFPSSAPTLNLSTFLLSFTQLRHLVIGHTSSYFDWSLISPENLESLQAVIRSGILQSLKFVCAYHVPISLFLMASSIRSLTLEETVLYEDSDDNDVLLIPLTNLEALHLGFEAVLGINYWEPFVTPNLRCLSVRGTERHTTKNIQGVIAEASDSIQDIIWHEYPSNIDMRRSHIGDVDLGVLSNLKSLSLVTPDLSNIEPTSRGRVWSAILVQVESYPVTENLERLSIMIISSAAVDPEYHRKLFGTPLSFWRIMDAVFSDVSRCPKLRHVEFHIDSRRYGQLVGDRLLLNTIAARLPHLPRSVSLTVKTHNSPDWRILL